MELNKKPIKIYLENNKIILEVHTWELMDFLDDYLTEECNIEYSYFQEVNPNVKKSSKRKFKLFYSDKYTLEQIFKEIQKIDENKINEIIFIDKIDCCFPYKDIKASEKLILEAKSISPNAVFTVIEELARIPLSERQNVSENELKNLLEKAIENFKHPILELILPTVFLMIKGEYQSVNKAITLMNEIANFPGLWGALSIIYSPCDDENGEVDTLYHEIAHLWSKTITLH